MKRIIAIFTTVLLLAGSLSGCASGAGKPDSGKEGIRIVTTIFPEYDWVMNILGDNPADAEVTLLLDSGVDLHSFQPTAADIMKISTCDVFIYVGGESDEWVEDALQESVNSEMIVIDLLNILGDAAKEEEVIEGMQGEDENDEDGEDEEHEHDEDEVEYDEHVWLSLRNAAVFVGVISDALQSVDPANADLYRTNAEAYIEMINTLDDKYRAAVSEASFKTLLFGDRFPFRYLVDDYGLSYYAAFVGCSAETEASFETITFLSRKVDELSLPAVMTIEGTDHRIAETIVQNTVKKDLRILSMDSMQAVTAKDIENGVTYISIMEKNLSVLKDALN
ncbi:MAG: metal ABC transporter substrate-binding protein [Eubacteriales bacterium]|nr:metal ABC transporter substrate-binding protein [Eubacteriales bacterium]